MRRSDFLLGFAESTFRQGKYSDVMLIYLCKYFNGPTKQMAELWKAAGEFQIDTFDLEERILTQMLYTTDYTPHMEEIYEVIAQGAAEIWSAWRISLICQYVSHGGRRRAGACVPPDQGALSDRGRSKPRLPDCTAKNISRRITCRSVTERSRTSFVDTCIPA